MPFLSGGGSGIFLCSFDGMNKGLVLGYLNQLLDEKITVLRDNLASLTEARNNEDKCTVGDKYETGRAMTQMELEKTQAQLYKTEELRTMLSKIDVHSVSQKVAFGSLVETNSGNYFFSFAFGKIELNEESVFCLSPVSPIGQVLLGKQKNDKVLFQGKEIQIDRIS